MEGVREVLSGGCPFVLTPTVPPVLDGL